MYLFHQCLKMCLAENFDSPKRGAGYETTVDHTLIPEAVRQNNNEEQQY
jgi:hypothetical protein